MLTTVYKRKTIAVSEINGSIQPFSHDIRHFIICIRTGTFQEFRAMGQFEVSTATINFLGSGKEDY